MEKLIATFTLSEQNQPVSNEIFLDCDDNHFRLKSYILLANGERQIFQDREIANIYREIQFIQRLALGQLIHTIKETHDRGHVQTWTNSDFFYYPSTTLVRKQANIETETFKRGRLQTKYSSNNHILNLEEVPLVVRQKITQLTPNWI